MGGTHTRARGRWIALIAAAGLLASCGGDDDADGESSTAGTDRESATSDAESTSPTDDSGTTNGTASESTATESSEGEQSENVDRDAELVYATCCAPTGLDPHNQPGAFITGWFELYDRLLYVGTPEDPLGSELRGMVAESWEFSDEGLTLTLSLRDDVFFNDGTPLTAEAVKASLERAQLSDFTAGSRLSAVSSINVVDDQTVTLELSEPDAGLPAALAMHSGAVMNPAVFNDPSVDLDNAPPPAAGSGAFVIESFEPGIRVRFARADEEYWDPEANHLAVLDVVGEPDENTRINGLRSGEYDMAVVFENLDEAERLGEEEEFDNHHIIGRSVGVVWLRYSNEALSDVRVRQAIAHAVDREGMSDAVYGGTCAPIDQFWPEGNLGYDPDFETPYPYDLDQARALLDEAGVENLTIDVLVPSGSPMVGYGTVLQAALAEIGITANLTEVPPSETPAEFASGDYDLSINAIVAAPDDSMVVGSELYSRNDLTRGDQTVIELTNKGTRLTDPDERAEVYRDIGNHVVVDEVWGIPICTPAFSWPHRAEVINADRQPFQWTALPAQRYLGIVNE